MTHHDLKVWPEYFSSLRAGVKSFEIRKNDRDYRKGDTMTLREWNPDTEKYTGRQVSRRITFILEGAQFGLEKGYVAMAIR